MELTTGTLLQYNHDNIMIMVTNIGGHWLTYKTVTSTDGWDHLVNQVQLRTMRELILNGDWRIIG